MQCRPAWTRRSASSSSPSPPTPPSASSAWPPSRWPYGSTNSRQRWVNGWFDDKNQFLTVFQLTTNKIQGSAKEWSLGCVIPASWSPLATVARFTQPRDHYLADPCVVWNLTQASHPEPGRPARRQVLHGDLHRAGTGIMYNAGRGPRAVVAKVELYLADENNIGRRKLVYGWDSIRTIKHHKSWKTNVISQFQAYKPLLENQGATAFGWNQCGCSASSPSLPSPSSSSRWP